MREGWQILSDIGHAVNVTWEGQNKEYNKNHPACMRWRKDQDTFGLFLKYYIKCLLEYSERFDVSNKFHSKFSDFCFNKIECKIKKNLPKKRTEEQMTIDYLLQAKKNHLTKYEIKKLKSYVKP